MLMKYVDENDENIPREMIFQTKYSHLNIWCCMEICSRFEIIKMYFIWRSFNGSFHNSQFNIHASSSSSSSSPSQYSFFLSIGIASARTSTVCAFLCLSPHLCVCLNAFTGDLWCFGPSIKFLSNSRKKKKPKIQMFHSYRRSVIELFHLERIIG